MAASWKELPRHPLSSEYRNLTGPAWDRFRLRMKRFGFLKDKPIYIHNGMVIDGWQRLRACIETNTEPVLAPMPEGMDPQEFVELMNDERRHESKEERAERVEARRKRVDEGRHEGKSQRTLAAEEGVSRAQIQEDLKAIEGGGQDCPPVPTPQKVTGRDGRKQSAKKTQILCHHCLHRQQIGKPLIEKCEDCKKARALDKAKDRLCNRCKEIGYQDGCTACQYLRENPGKKAPKPPKERFEDDSGAVVPQRLLPMFKAADLFKQAERAFNKAAEICKEIENDKHLRALTPLEGKKHYGEMFGPLKNARWRMRNMRPSLVCKACDGDSCEHCDDGVLTVEKAKARAVS